MHFFVGFSLHDTWLDQLRDTKIPAVLFDNYIPNNPHVSYIGTDNDEGIDAAIEHLYQLGHRKIAFLNGPSYSMISKSRHQAFIDSMEKHDLIVHPELAVYGDFLFGNCQRACSEFLSQWCQCDPLRPRCHCKRSLLGMPAPRMLASQPMSALSVLTICRSLLPYIRF